jgi:hypothetical protein
MAEFTSAGSQTKALILPQENLAKAQAEGTMPQSGPQVRNCIELVYVTVMNVGNQRIKGPLPRLGLTD